MRELDIEKRDSAHTDKRFEVVLTMGVDNRRLHKRGPEHAQAGEADNEAGFSKWRHESLCQSGLTQDFLQRHNAERFADAEANPIHDGAGDTGH